MYKIVCVLAGIWVLIKKNISQPFGSGKRHNVFSQLLGNKLNVLTEIAIFNLIYFICRKMNTKIHLALHFNFLLLLLLCLHNCSCSLSSSRSRHRYRVFTKMSMDLMGYEPDKNGNYPQINGKKDRKIVLACKVDFHGDYKVHYSAPSPVRAAMDKR